MDADVLKSKAMKFYCHMFAPTNPFVAQPLELGGFVTLPCKGVNSLLAPVTKEEVFIALRSMKSLKAPGPDGFQPFFFKTY